MPKATLLLVFHNHQPTGNLEEVFSSTTEACYAPLVEILFRHSSLKFTLHFTGPLWNWLEEHRPQLFEKLKFMVDRGQVEIMGGAYYEPMLAILPERDAVGQLTLMRRKIQERFNYTAQGMWLAERVWEPDLPRIISAGGYRYTLLDDAHFHTGGLTGELDGYYVTEKGGHPLAIFPISQALRYAIPFKDPLKVIEEIHRLADEKGGENTILTYGDDGEKFGVWPGTRDLVWNRGWLEQFFTALEEHHDTIVTSTPSQILRERRTKGRVYLPTASYVEMGEWSLVPSAQTDYKILNALVETITHRVDTFKKKRHYDDFLTPLLSALEKLPPGWIERYLQFMESGGDHLIRGSRKLLSKLERRLPFLERLDGLLYIAQEIQPVLKGTDIMLNVAGEIHSLLDETLRVIASAGENPERLKSFIQGGIWQGFLAKYHEANLIHKRMLQISNRLAHLFEQKADQDITLLEDAQDHLYQAQCNCAYWHGIFGGLYMVHMRHALYHHLLVAEHLMDRFTALIQDQAHSYDYDMDLDPEVFLTGPHINAIVKPNLGATIVELDLKDRHFNITNVMTRVEEGYHGDLQVRSPSDTQQEQTTTIHHHADYVEPTMLDSRVYDLHPRAAYTDYFLSPSLSEDTLLKEFSHRNFKDQGDFAGARWELVELKKEEALARLSRRGNLCKEPVQISKEFHLEGTTLTVRYTFILLSNTPVTTRFAPESSYSLLADTAEDRRLLVDGKSPPGAAGLSSAEGLFPGARSFSLRSGYDGLQFTVSFDRPATLLSFPFYSLSKSETGVELNYQGTSLTPVFPLEITPASPVEITFTLRSELFPPER